MDFKFLKSMRFYKLLATAIVQFLYTQGIVSKEVSDGVTLVLLGSVFVRTADRFSENLKP